jgi:acyl carrier protein
LQYIVSKSVVQEVFAEMLDLDPQIDWSVVRYQEVTGWDSLAHMAIVGELEDRFDIMLDTDDIIEMSSFERSLEILAKYGVAVG